MQERRRRHSEVRLDQLQEEAERDDEPRGILELFDRDDHEVEADEDAPLRRDPE